MQLIVLAAGKGTRLPKKFRKNPKCLVKINKKPLIYYNEPFYKKFDKKIIISGYKTKNLETSLKKMNFQFINNKNYKSTNMVYSLSLAKQYIKQDVVVVYGDIIFNSSLFKILKTKDNLLPVNRNWFKNWKKRMGLQKTLIDAENLIIKKKLISEIGTKINSKKIPNYQYMGVMKFKKDTFVKIISFFYSLKNKKIDMTSFLNLCIKNKILKMRAKFYYSYWYEIDTASDHKFAQKEIKKFYDKKK